MKLYKNFLLISCVLTPPLASALKPSEDKAFGLIWNNVTKNHLTVTKEGLKDFSINGESLSFSPQAILEIQTANAEVDANEASKKEAHCDGEYIGESFGCSARLIQIKANIINLLSSNTGGNHLKARVQLGRALHTLQDFYAHSNWVNDVTNHNKIYYDLTDYIDPNPTSTFEQTWIDAADTYAMGEIKPKDKSNYKTCEWDLESFDEQPLEIATLGKRGLAVITTGYFEGPIGSFDPEYYKCDHGIKNGNGLNKDTQHQPFHDEAVTAATLHTTHYAKTIINAVLASTALPKEELANNVAKFMGEYDDINVGFVIDTTNSMQPVISGIKKAVKDTVLKLDNEGKQITNFYQMSYGDPGIGSVLTANNNTTMQDNVNTVELCVPDCGGDSPERTLDALLTMVNIIAENTHVYVYTDARTLNLDLKSSIIQKAKNKHIKINFLLSGDIDSVYYDIANTTQGNIYNYAHSVSGAEETFTYINPQFEGNVDKILNISGSIPGGTSSSPVSQKVSSLAKVSPVVSSQSSGSHFYATSAKTSSDNATPNKSVYSAVKQKSAVDAVSTSTPDVIEKFFVDDTSSSIFVNVKMDPIGEITLRRPDGTAVLATDDGVTITNTNVSSNINATDLVFGEWSVEISGAAGQNYEIDVDVSSGVNILDFGFKEYKGRAGHEGLFDINGEPTIGTEQYISLTMVGDVSDIKMTVNLLDGTLYNTVELSEVASGSTSRYLGRVLLPSQSFVVVVTGESANGDKFTRTYNQVYLPQKISINPVTDKPVVFSPNTKYDIGFDITNFGLTDTFTLSAVLEDGTPINIANNTLLIDQNTTGNARLIFTTPANLEAVDDYSITFTATSVSDSESSNYAIFTADFDAIDSDNDSIVDDTENDVGDGNSDGIADDQQANVTSFLSTYGIGFTYEVDESLALSNFVSGELEGGLEELLNVKSDYGYVEFTLNNVSSTSVVPANVKVTFSRNINPSGYYVYNALTNTWIEDTTVELFNGFANIKVSHGSHKGFFDFSNASPQVFIKKTTIAKNETISINLLENTLDTDGDTIVIHAFDDTSLESGVITLIEGSSNSVSFTPKADFVGTDYFSFTITDNNGGFATRDAEIEITDSDIIVTEPPVVVVPPVITEQVEEQGMSNSEGGSFSLWVVGLLGLLQLSRSRILKK